MDARARRDPVRLHRGPRPVRRTGHRRRAGQGTPLRRRGRGARRLQGAARARRPDRAAVRRVPHPDGGQAVLQHHAARARGHRHQARAGDGGARRRHLGRRVDVQGQRHRALLSLRAARQREPAHLQAVARHRLRRRARRPQGDERVAASSAACRTARRSRRRTRPTRTCSARPTRRKTSNCSRRR